MFRVSSSAGNSKTGRKEMKQHDILLEKKGNLEWVCGLFNNDLNDAIACAVREMAPARYVGHKSFKVVCGEWVACDGVSK
mgnify:CR=1 FL=1